ncbi:bifunctional 2-polyprenyl-6-hydroxyphenol methylase/3-demethylubiquinol 3-O-methyltransferase UbiG [Streptomyces sp. 2131.1]|uniref:class I SAM-dependent methyltransferase n=1 Tax=unclassified Streptomyces TaxID=2593676 RepID=UPI00089B3BC9|nr:class I SAM-dependent methyltransferase [Streptomyces sp. 2131.1]SEE31428.1 Methyltransferase domain-containing protein [Streptomyces sp. 2131.1]
MSAGQPRTAAAVFDALGTVYEEAFAGSAAHRASLDRLLAVLPEHGRVLDIGSGTGRPTAQTLVDAGHEVLGVDVSPVMVDIASRQVPAAEFRCADIRTLALEDGAFDAVCMYFALLQMSRSEQGDVLRLAARVLRPEGHLAVATVPLDVEGVGGTFMGQPVEVTSFGEDAFTALVEEAGFSVLSRTSTMFVPAVPAAVPEPQMFLLARRR